MMGIDLRNCSCADPAFLEASVGADLVIADPPWKYRNGAIDSGSDADDHYPGLEVEKIAELLNAIGGKLLVLWCTWPLLGEWSEAWRQLAIEWESTPVSGMAWTKSGPDDSGHYGPGFYAAGCSEPVLIYRRQGAIPYVDRSVPLRNAWIEAPAEHSRKPVKWQAQWAKRYCAPGGLIVDPFAGLASVAEAAILAGRRYLGAEIDPKRHAEGLALLPPERRPWEPGWSAAQEIRRRVGLTGGPRAAAIAGVRGSLTFEIRVAEDGGNGARATLLRFLLDDPVLRLDR